MNGMPAICIPLPGVVKKTSPNHKSTSCQTEVLADSQTSDHESILQAQASGNLENQLKFYLKILPFMILYEASNSELVARNCMYQIF